MFYVKHVFLYKFSFANNLSCGGKNIRHEKIIILIVCVLSACFAAAQEPVPVLTLGTFHFDFPNLDQVQYAESEQIDVLNPVYQNEIETLVGLLEKFAPTIIVIERPVKMQFETDSLFRRYVMICSEEKTSRSDSGWQNGWG